MIVIVIVIVCFCLSGLSLADDRLGCGTEEATWFRKKGYRSSSKVL